MKCGGAFRLTASRTWYSLALFVTLVGGVVLVRPDFVFRPDGSMYDFGCGADRSIFSFGVVTSFAAIASSFIFAMRDLVRRVPPMDAASMAQYRGR